MKISAIAMVRNESEILKESLDYVSTLVDDIYLYDDCSTDDTVKIAESHDKVKKVVRGLKWEDNKAARSEANGTNRNAAYIEALKGKPDYVYCFDVDEVADFTGIEFKHDYYTLRLFDFYSTLETKDLKWNEKIWMGPEYRNITMLFRPMGNTKFMHREPSHVGNDGKNAGYVKHFSKCISEKRWEEDCDYYSKYFPAWAKKWENRRGGYIHEKSDFNKPLIKWEDRFKQNLIINI